MCGTDAYDGLFIWRPSAVQAACRIGQAARPRAETKGRPVMSSVSQIGWSFAGFAITSVAILGAHMAGLHHGSEAPPPASASGATFTDLGSGSGHRLVVTSLRTGGAASAAGLHVGDRIETIDGRRAQSPGAAEQQLEKALARPVDLQVWRGPAMVHLKLFIPGGNVGQSNPAG